MRICGGIQLAVSMAAQMPLEKIRSEKANCLVKMISAVAIAVLTVFSLGYYAYYAHRYYADQKLSAAQLQLEGAIGNNDLDRVKEIFRTLPESKKLLNGYQGRTPNLIHIAVIHQHIPMVAFLASQGADLNGEGRVGTPLAAALYRGHLAMTAYLLQNGADPNRGHGFSSPLILALTEAPYPVQLDLVLHLLRHHANPNIESQFSLLRLVANHWETEPEKSRATLLLLLERGDRLKESDPIENPEILQFIRAH